MIQRLLLRLAGTIPTLLVVVAITFLLMRAAPGGPFDGEKAIPAAIKAELLAQYELDGPITRQFTDYLGDILHGDLRLSTKYRNRTVNELIAQTLPVSLALGSAAFVIAVTGGVLLGAWSAARDGTVLGWFLLLLALLGISLPAFVLGPLLVAAFSFGTGWLPVGGWGSPSQWVLPALTLSLPYMAYVARLTRVSMLEVLSQDYIRTAHAKGLTETPVLLKHALRNAALPVVSYCGPLAANILTGSLVVEEVFKVPGMGQFFVNAVLNRDVFLVGGVTLVFSVMLIGFNILVDMAYTWLDPRVRLE
jgi:ABC-type dipeptide/oligopeptide/nickel transport system permease component